ncbi:PKD domain-containing protein [Micromonospora chersina]|uniref:PKD domain-containing protein n=1 Tax=Micromonospora chersina TaxID=47854 RepID=UPI0033CE4A3A
MFLPGRPLSIGFPEGNDALRLRDLGISSALAVGVAVLGLPAVAQSAPTEMVDVIVTLDAKTVDPAAAASAQTDRLSSASSVRSVYRHALKGYAARVPASAVAALRAAPGVAAVDYDGTFTIVGASSPWGSWPAFDNPTGQAQDTPTGVRRINAHTNPNLDIDGVDDKRIDVDVAITDTGVDFDHPDLNVVSRADCTSGTCVDNAGDDDNGHGSHVAGTVGAIDNGFGVVGVAPGARLHSIKVLDSSNSGQWSWLVAAYDYIAARSTTIEVVNSSIGGGGEPAALLTAVRNMTSRGVVLVVAAGNNNENALNSAPAKYDEPITVSALADSDGKPGGTGGAPSCRADQDDTNADFSNWGTQVDIAAPGVCINSTFRDGGYNPSYSGTSMASPHVAGAAALVASVNKPTNQSGVNALRDYLTAAGNLNWTDNSGDGVKERLLDVGDPTKFPPAAGGNKPPTASFTSNCTALNCSFDGTASTDPDGSVSSWAWTFGDGTTGAGSTTSHTYAATGSYTVTLTVTDNQGATNSTSKTVTVTGGGTNQAPAASFTHRCYSNFNPPLCFFDGTASTDPDGSISSWAWTFGDGTTGTGRQSTHNYARTGTYTVTLTVTDNGGAKNSTSKTITVP